MTDKGCPKCASQMTESEKYRLEAEKPNMGMWLKVHECSKCQYIELYKISPR